MPSAFTHAFTGAAISTLAPRRFGGLKLGLVLAAVAALPDLDVVAFRFGIPYSHPLGHRGLSHSLLFALIVATAVWFCFARGGRLFSRPFGLLIVIVRQRRIGSALQGLHLTRYTPTVMSTVPAEGGCLCGAIRYRAGGQPRSATLCHCATCRKAAGSPLVAWVTFPAQSFSFASGKPVEYRSSAKVIRTFCGSCGTPLTYVHADFPAGVDVTTCSLDDPESFAPADHTFVSERLSWVHIDDHLPARPERV